MTEPCTKGNVRTEERRIGRNLSLLTNFIIYTLSIFVVFVCSPPPRGAAAQRGPWPPHS